MLHSFSGSFEKSTLALTFISLEICHASRKLDPCQLYKDGGGLPTNN